MSTDRRAQPALSLRRGRMNLTDLAYEAIEEAIMDQRLPPGAPLRIEALCAQLTMSSSPVREALFRAAGAGLVAQDTNRGFQVTPLLSATTFHQLYQVRRLLELGALTPGRGTGVDTTELRTLAERMAGMGSGPQYRDFHEFNRADHIFHRALVGTGGNPLLTEAWERLHFHMHIGRLYAGVGIIDFAVALREHDAIVRALESGDRSALRRLAATHIRNSERRLSALVR